MKSDIATEREIKAVLDEFVESYEKQDLEKAMSIIASDADVVMYGTGANEKCVGSKEIRAQFKKDWSQIENPALKYNWTLISSAGNVAWTAIDAVLNVKLDGKNQNFPLRITKVLEKRENKWLIVQAHFSFPDQSEFFD
ncbi:MAG: nuclear transport factor 2 family protein [Methanosarcina sp.]